MVNEAYNKIIKEERFNYLLIYQYDPILMRHYHLYHDCGKSYCKVIDKQGKIHYPDHANKSAQIHAKHFDAPEANWLIKNDMIFHSCKGEELKEWMNENTPQVIASLYLTAWSEIMANAQLFGGLESDTFKIKKKRLIQHGKKIEELFIKQGLRQLDNQRGPQHL